MKDYIFNCCDLGLPILIYLWVTTFRGTIDEVKMHAKFHLQVDQCWVW